MTPEKKSVAEELEECRRDPPPPPTWDTAGARFEEGEMKLLSWINRHPEYINAPKFWQLHQLPSMSALWGYDEFYYRRSIMRELVDMSQFAGRRLTRDEMDLFLQHASRWVVAESYDRPAAIAATALLYAQGRKDYRFPFYQPTFVRFDPHCFPSPSRPFFTGFLATTAWQGVRMGAYGVAGLLAYRYLSPRYRSLFDEERMILLEEESRLEKLATDVRNNLERWNAER